MVRCVPQFISFLGFFTTVLIAELRVSALPLRSSPILAPRVSTNTNVIRNPRPVNIPTVFFFSSFDYFTLSFKAGLYRVKRNRYSGQPTHHQK
jgi:hypothetical protein